MSAVLLLGALAALPAWAQDSDEEDVSTEEAAPEDPPPSLEESLAFLNELLSNNPSDLRPCLGATTGELGESGVLLITTTRKAYCPDTQVRVHVQDLDSASVEASVTERGTVEVGCSDDTCVRWYHKRKERGDGAWVLRDETWRAGGEPAQGHRSLTASVLVGADQRTAVLAQSSLAYVIRSARRDSRYAAPKDVFAGRIAQSPDAPAP
jgi:hypothetical protein